MALSYAKFSKKPQIFLKLFGIDPEKAWKIIEAVKVLWEQEIVGKYKRPGRNSKLGLAERVLLVLLYYRSYSLYLCIGLWFGVDLSQVCRIIKRLEPLLARVMVIPEDRTLNLEDGERLMDATELPIQRPKKDQKQ